MQAIYEKITEDENIVTEILLNELAFYVFPKK